jgi:hypothetical protein
LTNNKFQVDWYVGGIIVVFIKNLTKNGNGSHDIYTLDFDDTNSAGDYLKGVLGYRQNDFKIDIFNKNGVFLEILGSGDLISNIPS